MYGIVAIMTANQNNSSETKSYEHKRQANNQYSCTIFASRIAVSEAAQPTDPGEIIA